jgi:23S rRNA (cytosine1962-C5)-methyltransferase
MFKDLEIILKYITNLPGLQVKTVYNKSKSSLPHKSDIDLKNDFLKGESSGDIVREYGCKFKVDIVRGQKTGFFVDQRENRKLLEKYSEGRNVLNMFGYSGGFSVYAMRGGAQLVHTVDASAKAAELADENVKLNFQDTSLHQSFAKDVFDYFEDPPARYDLIILDPPAFAKHHNVLSNALQGYKKINRRAMELIEKGGILFTFSCSQVVSRENFRKSVFTAAANTGRKVTLLHQLSQPADHPVSIYHPEGEYLKGLILKID